MTVKLTLRDSEAGKDFHFFFFCLFFFYELPSSFESTTVHFILTMKYIIWEEALKNEIEETNLGLTIHFNR